MTVHVQKLGEQVTERVARRIVNEEISAGQNAPSEQEIINEFGVSKGVAREVIASLVTKGLINVQHGRRPKVRAVEEWNVFDPLILEVQDNPEVLRRMVLAMNELRSALEPEIAALAATAATDEQRATLRALLERMEERPDNLLELDVAFHLELARATQNPLFVHVIESVRNLLRVSVERRADYVQRELEGVPPYHRLIFEAVEARDADAARKAMREHMAMAGPIWTSEQG